MGSFGSIGSMIERIEQLEKDALAELAGASDVRAVEAIRAKFLGRQDGLLTLLQRGVRDLPADQRPAFGARANKAKEAVEGRITEALARFGKEEQTRRLAAAAVDVTLPGRKPPRGTVHPLTQTMEEIIGVFQRMGFAVERGPEIEADFYNFEALNFPDDHPARDMQDTFFVGREDGEGPAAVKHPRKEGAWSPVLLRTHTSPVQIRTMLSRKPPIRVICPGRVFRNDNDLRHSPMFHQVEGLAVAEGITVGHLKGTLLAFLRRLFSPDVEIRLRPSFFPFTEPSAEVDITCQTCKGKGCATCSGTGWMEILGCGMVDPRVLDECGIDPDRYSGFAFGMGVDRVAMNRYGIGNIRTLFDNDERLLRQVR